MPRPRSSGSTASVSSSATGPVCQLSSGPRTCTSAWPTATEPASAIRAKVEGSANNPR
jgi:hypothetical protein